MTRKGENRKRWARSERWATREFIRIKGETDAELVKRYSMWAWMCGYEASMNDRRREQRAARAKG